MAWTSLQSWEELGQGQEAIHWRGRWAGLDMGSQRLLCEGVAWLCRVGTWAGIPVGLLGGACKGLQQGERKKLRPSAPGRCTPQTPGRSRMARPSVGRGLLSAIW